MHLKMLYGKWRPSCLGLNVLRVDVGKRCFQWIAGMVQIWCPSSGMGWPWRLKYASLTSSKPSRNMRGSRPSKWPALSWHWLPWRWPFAAWSARCLAVVTSLHGRLLRQPQNTASCRKISHDDIGVVPLRAERLSFWRHIYKYIFGCQFCKKNFWKSITDKASLVLIKET